MYRGRERERDRDSSEVKMFISKPQIDEVMKKDDQSTAYIIQQNSVLTQKILDLTQELNEMEKEKEEIETYSERLEKTRTCLQGYVRNEHDTMLKYKQLYENEKKMMYLYYNEFLITQIIPLIMFIIVLFGKKLYILNIYFLSTLYIIMASSYVIIIYASHTYLHNNRHTTEIKEIIDTITKTTQSNIYIDDLIDNM